MGNALEIVHGNIDGDQGVIALKESIGDIVVETARTNQHELEKSVEDFWTGASKPRECGYVAVYYGPMRSNKTTAGLAIGEIAENRGLSVTRIKPTVDTRDDKMQSCNGSSGKCVRFEEMKNEDLYKEDVLIVDEVQFFDFEQIVRLEMIIRERAKRGRYTAVCMLNQDFRGEYWDNFAWALGMVENLQGRAYSLHAICECCGGQSSMTQRLVWNAEAGKYLPARIDDPIVAVENKECGGNEHPDVYQSRCQEHHKVYPAMGDEIES